MLRIADVAKDYGAFHLGPVSLDVGNEIVVVLGPSGCGKTTLLSIVAGVVRPDGGSVSLGGAPLDGRAPEDRGTPLVFQDGALFPHMTARENIAYAASSPGRVSALAAALEIEDVLDSPARELSGGQRQRVALARALATDPDALLLDEPLSNLDAPIKRRLRDEMRERLTALSIPVLYVTHDQREATAIGDRIAVMRDGRFHQVGTPAAVFDRPHTPFVASFTGNDNVFEAVAADGGTALDWGSHRLRMRESNADPGESVLFCVRPEHVAIVDDPETENAIRGRVVGRQFEGDGYLVEVAIDGVERNLRFRVLPGRYDQVGLDDREAVWIAVPPGAIHVFDGTGE